MIPVFLFFAFITTLANAGISLEEAQAICAAQNLGEKIQKSYQSPYRALGMKTIGPVYRSGSDYLSCIFNVRALNQSQTLDSLNLEKNVPVGTGFSPVKLDMQNFWLAIDYAVRAYFIFEGAAYHNSFAVNNRRNISANDGYLAFPDATEGDKFLPNCMNGGDFVDFGVFPAKTAFFLFLIQNGAYGGKYVFGPYPEDNPDGLSHVVSYALAGTPWVLIGFEDFFGGGDRDFNDLVVVMDVGEGNVNAQISLVALQNKVPEGGYANTTYVPPTTTAGSVPGAASPSSGRVVPADAANFSQIAVSGPWSPKLELLDVAGIRMRRYGYNVTATVEIPLEAQQNGIKSIPIKIVDNKDGTYSTNATFPWPGVYKVSFRYGGLPFTDMPYNVTVRVPVPIAGSVLDRSNYESIPALAVWQPVVQTRDPFRKKNMTTGGRSLVANIVGISGAGSKTNVATVVSDNKDGTYTIYSVFNAMGVYNVSATIDGFPLDNAPFFVTVTNAKSSGGRWVDPTGAAVPVPVKTTWATNIQATDSTGNPLSTNGGVLEAHASHTSASVSVPLTMTDTGTAGIYQVSASWPIPGKYSIQASLDSKVVSTPTTLYANAVAGEMAGSYVFDGKDRTVENQAPYLTTYVNRAWSTWLQAVDADRNLVYIGGSTVKAIAVPRGFGDPIELGTLDGQNGTYFVTKSSGFDQPGVYDVYLGLDDYNTVNTPIPVTVKPSPATSGRFVLPAGVTSPSVAATVSLTVPVQLFDKNGKPVDFGGTPVYATARGPSSAPVDVPLTVVDYNNGTYGITGTFPTAGLYQLSTSIGLVDGGTVPLVNSPLGINVAQPPMPGGDLLDKANGLIALTSFPWSATVQLLDPILGTPMKTSVAADSNGVTITASANKFNASTFFDSPFAVSVTDNTDGTYTLRTIFPNPGLYNVSMSYTGRTIGGTPFFVNSYPVGTVVNSPEKYRTAITGTKWTAPVHSLYDSTVVTKQTGTTVSFSTVTSNVPIKVGGIAVASSGAVSDVGNIQVPVAIRDLNDGTYELSAVFSSTGMYSVYASALGGRVRNTPLRVNVSIPMADRGVLVSSSGFSIALGDSWTGVVQTYDTNNLPSTLGGANITIAVTPLTSMPVAVGCSAVTNGKSQMQVIDNGNGIYNLSAFMSFAGTFRISATMLGGKGVSGFPMNVNVAKKTADEIVANGTVIAQTPSVISLNGLIGGVPTPLGFSGVVLVGPDGTSYGPYPACPDGTVKLNVTQDGTYRLYAVDADGLPVSKKPLVLTVQPSGLVATGPVASGITVEGYGYLGGRTYELNSFKVVAKDGAGNKIQNSEWCKNLTSSIVPPSPARTWVTTGKSSKGSCIVTYYSEIIGMHTLPLLYGRQHILNSPFKPVLTRGVNAPVASGGLLLSKSTAVTAKEGQLWQAQVQLIDFQGIPISGGDCSDLVATSTVSQVSVGIGDTATGTCLLTARVPAGISAFTVDARVNGTGKVKDFPLVVGVGKMSLVAQGLPKHIAPNDAARRCVSVTSNPSTKAFDPSRWILQFVSADTGGTLVTNTSISNGIGSACAVLKDAGAFNLVSIDLTALPITEKTLGTLYVDAPEMNIFPGLILAEDVEKEYLLWGYSISGQSSATTIRRDGHVRLRVYEFLSPQSAAEQESLDQKALRLRAGWGASRINIYGQSLNVSARLTDNLDGSYSFRTTVGHVGRFSASVLNSQRTVISSKPLSLVAVEPNSPNVVVSTPSAAVVNSVSTIKIAPVDASGNLIRPCNASRYTVQIVSLSTGNQLDTMLSQTAGDQTCEAYFLSTSEGELEVTILQDGTALPDMPQTVTVVGLAGTAADAQNSYLEPRSLWSDAIVNEEWQGSSLCVVTDSNGAPVKTDAAAADLPLVALATGPARFDEFGTPLPPLSIPVDLTNNGDGTWNLNSTFPTVGNWYVLVSINGVQLKSSPIAITVKPKPDLRFVIAPGYELDGGPGNNPAMGQPNNTKPRIVFMALDPDGEPYQVSDPSAIALALWSAAPESKQIVPSNQVVNTMGPGMYVVRFDYPDNKNVDYEANIVLASEQVSSLVGWILPYGSAPNLLDTGGELSSDLASVTITFDTPTDRANKVGMFQCTDVVYSPSGYMFSTITDPPSCYWRDDTTLRVLFGNRAAIRVGDYVMLVSGAIRRKGAPSIAAASTGKIRVRHPPDGLPLTCRVSTFALIPADCPSFVVRLDSSAASGAGGRATSYIWTLNNSPLEAGSSEEAALSSALASASTNIVELEASLFPTAGVYNITLTVQNWLETVCTFSAPITKQPSVGRPVPFLTTYTNGAIKAARSGVSALIPAPISTGCNATAAVQYLWRQVSGPALAMPLENATNVRTLELFIPPYLLISYKPHIMQLQAWLTDYPSVRVSALVTLTLGSPPFKVEIWGGDRTVSVNQPLGVYAVTENDQYGAASRPSVVYEWACLSGNCFVSGSTFSLSKISVSKFVIPAQTFVSSKTHTIGVRGRKVLGDGTPVMVSNYTSIQVTVVDRLIANLVAGFDPWNEKKNPSDRLVLSSVLSDTAAVNVSNAGCTDAPILWKLILGDFNVTDESLRLTGISNQYLVISPDGLVAGQRYTWRLTAACQNGDSLAADVSFTTVEYPHSGRLEIHPTTGVAMSTVFTIQALEWTADPLEFPLMYEYWQKDVTASSFGYFPVERPLRKLVRNTFLSTLCKYTKAEARLEVVVYIVSASGAARRVSDFISIQDSPYSVTPLTWESNIQTYISPSYAVKDKFPVLFGAAQVGAWMLHAEAHPEAFPDLGGIPHAIRLELLNILNSMASGEVKIDSFEIASYACAMAMLTSKNMEADTHELSAFLMVKIARLSTYSQTVDASANFCFTLAMEDIYTTILRSQGLARRGVDGAKFSVTPAALKTVQESSAILSRSDLAARKPGEQPSETASGMHHNIIWRFWKKQVPGTKMTIGDCSLSDKSQAACAYFQFPSDKRFWDSIPLDVLDVQFSAYPFSMYATNSNLDSRTYNVDLIDPGNTGLLNSTFGKSLVGNFKMRLSDPTREFSFTLFSKLESSRSQNRLTLLHRDGKVRSLDRPMPTSLTWSKTKHTADSSVSIRAAASPSSGFVNKGAQAVNAPGFCVVWDSVAEVYTTKGCIVGQRYGTVGESFSCECFGTGTSRSLAAFVKWPPPTFDPTAPIVFDILAGGIEKVCSPSPFAFICTCVVAIPFFLQLWWANRKDKAMETSEYIAKDEYVEPPFMRRYNEGEMFLFLRAWVFDRHNLIGIFFRHRLDTFSTNQRVCCFWMFVQWANLLCIIIYSNVRFFQGFGHSLAWGFLASLIMLPFHFVINNFWRHLRHHSENFNGVVINKFKHKLPMNSTANNLVIERHTVDVLPRYRVPMESLVLTVEKDSFGSVVAVDPLGSDSASVGFSAFPPPTASFEHTGFHRAASVDGAAPPTKFRVPRPSGAASVSALSARQDDSRSVSSIISVPRAGQPLNLPVLRRGDSSGGIPFVRSDSAGSLVPRKGQPLNVIDGGSVRLAKKKSSDDLKSQCSDMSPRNGGSRSGHSDTSGTPKDGSEGKDSGFELPSPTGGSHVPAALSPSRLSDPSPRRLSPIGSAQRLLPHPSTTLPKRGILNSSGSLQELKPYTPMDRGELPAWFGRVNHFIVGLFCAGCMAIAMVVGTPFCPQTAARCSVAWFSSIFGYEVILQPIFHIVNGVLQWELHGRRTVGTWACDPNCELAETAEAD